MATPGNTVYTAFNDIVSTTLRAHSKETADNVSKHNALFRRLKERGNTRKEDGGYSIAVTLDYTENGTYQRFSGLDTLNISQSETFTSAEFPWRQSAVNVVASGEDLRKNSGSKALINLAKARIKNAQRSFANNLSADFYSDGALSNQVNGLQALISDAGTGTVGNIISGTFTWWKNKVQSAATPLQGGGSITPGPTTIEDLMLPLWLELTRGSDHPDLIVADANYFTYFEKSQTSLKRYAPEDTGQGGMLSLKYKNADVVYDSAASGIPANHMYFINTNYLEVVTHTDADITVMDEKSSANQDGVVIPVIWMGNLTVSNRSLQGVLKA